MDMPVVCSKVTSLIPSMDFFKRFNHSNEATEWVMQMACQRTRRTKCLLCVDSTLVGEMQQDKNRDHTEVIALGDRGQLCTSLATSTERIAAIVIKPFLVYSTGFPYYFSKVRELASAEGALMICDEIGDFFLKSNEYSKLAVRHHPDIICFNDSEEKVTFWIGVRAG